MSLNIKTNKKKNENICNILMDTNINSFVKFMEI